MPLVQVCNSGLTMGALAILGDDTTGIAKQMLGLTIPNAKANCALAVMSDGTWSETAKYVDCVAFYPFVY